MIACHAITYSSNHFADNLIGYIESTRQAQIDIGAGDSVVSAFYVRFAYISVALRRAIQKLKLILSILNSNIGSLFYIYERTDKTYIMVVRSDQLKS